MGIQGFKKLMASNELLCFIKSYILRESDKLRLIKTMVEDKNSRTCTAAVRHRIARQLNKGTEYSLTCGHLYDKKKRLIYHNQTRP